MVNSVSNTNAVQTALQGLQKASSGVNKAVKEAAGKEIDAEKLIELELAKKNAQIQTENLKTAIEASETILDILA